MSPGWRMVGVAFYAHLVAAGLGFYAMPRLLVPLADEFADGRRAGVALLAAAMAVAGMVCGPLVGRALLRFRLRTVMAAGAAVYALAFLAASAATSLWQLGIVYASLVPVSVAALSAVGANALVGNWFVRRRPLALGIAQFGMSISGALATFFISWTLATGDWRGTYLWFAAIAAGSCVLLAVFVRDHPSDRGLAPDGDPVDAAAPPAPGALPTLTFGAAMRDPNLWLVGVAAGVAFSGSTGLLQNAHAFATDAGYANVQADTLLAVISIGAALGKLVFGYLGVRFGERPAFWIAIGGEAVAMALLPFARETLGVLLAAGGLLGLTLGGVMPALAALLARLYGAQGFGPAMGYVSPILVPFQMIGAPLIAGVRDATGSYDAAILGFAASCALAALALVPIRMPAER